jgi:hypothetical protein
MGGVGVWYQTIDALIDFVLAFWKFELSLRCFTDQGNIHKPFEEWIYYIHSTVLYPQRYKLFVTLVGYSSLWIVVSLVGNRERTALFIYSNFINNDQGNEIREGSKCSKSYIYVHQCENCILS